MSRTKRENHNVECVLTDEERLKYSKQLAVHIAAIHRQEEELKAHSKQVKAEIAEMKKEVAVLSEKINMGREWRMMEVKVVWDWKNRIKQYIREDTGEIVGEKVITEEEIQEEADL